MKKIVSFLFAIFSLNAIELTVNVGEVEDTSIDPFGEEKAPADFTLTDMNGNSIGLQLSTLKPTEKRLKKALKSHKKKQKQ